MIVFLLVALSLAVGACGSNYYDEDAQQAVVEEACAEHDGIANVSVTKTGIPAAVTCRDGYAETDLDW